MSSFLSVGVAVRPSASNLDSNTCCNVWSFCSMLMVLQSDLHSCGGKSLLIGSRCMVCPVLHSHHFLDVIGHSATASAAVCTNSTFSL